MPVPEYGVPWPIFPRVSRILFLYDKIQVRENPYSGIFYALTHSSPDSVKVILLKAKMTPVIFQISLQLLKKHYDGLC